MPYYNESPDEIFKELKTSPKGLSQKEADERLKKYGRNELKKKKGPGPIAIFLSQFKSPLVIILIAAAAIAYGLGEKNDAIVIGVVVLINAIVGFIQEFKAEKALEALIKMIAPKARVIRDGKEQIIDAHLIVPGDILVFEAGKKVVADARIFECYEISVEEAALTGESTPVRKTSEAILKQHLVVGDMKNMVFTGTSIAEGSGKAVVTETGMHTEFGKVAKLTQEVKKSATPLQKELGKVGRFIGVAVIIICAIVFAIILLRAGQISKEVVVEGFIFAVALAVAAVPEGLPATVTIALAIGVQRMVKKHALIRKLNSIETLGSTTVICSDKTGTLTKNEMTVREIFADSQTIDVSGIGYMPEGEFAVNKKQISKQDLKKMSLFFSISAVCNNSTLEKTDGKWSITGDPTEAALVVASRKAGFSKEDFSDEYEKVYELPFDSKRKMMSVICKSGKKKYAFVKGAPDEILKKCSKIFVNGHLMPLTSARKKAILKKNDEMASKALRVLSLAYREITGKTKKYTIKNTELNLVFVGMVGMIDPPRHDVKESVALCKKAGIKIFVITGDHGITARAIAEKIGIASPKTQVIEGTVLDKMSESQLERVLDKETIFARISPHHKLRVVEALERKGEVVAVTGDGVNDAPALKKASIGIAMGISGTDVSQAASDMVLADDSFSTIVSAVEEGRSIYDNIKKFMRYLFSSNLGEISVIFFAMLIGLPYPVLAVQILWVNLVTDVFPALSLGVEPPEKDIMERHPRDPKKRIITPKIFSKWLVTGLIIGIGTLAVFIWQLTKGGWQFGGAVGIEDVFYLKALTMSFSTLVIYQLVNVFNCRSDSKTVFSLGFFTNKWLLIAAGVSLALQFMVVHVGFFQRAFYTTALTPMEWLIVLIVPMSIFIYDELRKTIWKTSKSKRGDSVGNI